jgi:alpha-amylase
MGEWALPVGAGRELLSAQRELTGLASGQRWQDLLRGGFWRAFLVKYPEVAEMYWKMLRLSTALHDELARRPDDVRLHAARTALWRGQANDAYWHGVFGGCYLPHLRRAVKQSLLDCERLMAEVTSAPALGWTRGDVNGDGREEVVVRTDRLAMTINPELGGVITELAWLPAGLDLADVLTRRPELYHDRVDAKNAGALQYDELRRASSIDGLFDAGEPLDPIAPWSSARWVLGRDRLATRLDERGDSLDVVMTAPSSAPLIVDKRLTVHGSAVEIRYRLRARDGEILGDRWAVQWNLAMTAGSAPDRYLTLPARPTLGSSGRAHVAAVTLVDEWIGVEAALTWTEGAELAWGPVETISVTESGPLERIYQGTALLLTWSLDGRGTETELVVGLTVTAR